MNYLYYIEWIDLANANLYCVEDFNRHKIWVEHPKAVLISEKAYYAALRLKLIDAATPNQQNPSL